MVKRNTISFFIFLLLLLFASCGGSKENNKARTVQYGEKKAETAGSSRMTDSFSNADTMVQKAAAETRAALSYLDKGDLNTASKILRRIRPEDFGSDKKDRMTWYAVMSKLYRLENNAKQELHYLDLSYALEDSLKQHVAAIQAPDPAAVYSRLERKRLIEQMEGRNRLHKVFARSAETGGLLFILLCAIIFIRLRRSRKYIEKMKVLHTTLKLREAELTKLMQDREKQKRAELLTRLRIQEMQLQMDHNDAISAQRASISDDMHDELSSSLAALKYYVEDLGSRTQNEKMKGIFAGLTEEVLFIYTSAREHMHNLRANIQGTHYELIYFLDDIAQKFRDKGLLAISTDIDRETFRRDLTPVQHDQLYHIMREIISNIIKYAEADAVHITISIENESCTFCVSDNGKGLNENLIEEGIGPGDMYKRMEMLKGQLNIQSSDRGTVVRGSFPLM